MTKPTRKSARLAALDQLTNILMDRLQNAGPEGMTVPEITEGLGFATSTVRARLALLQDSGRVYRVRQTQIASNAIVYTWHATVVTGHAVDVDGPRRTITRNFPLINRCDPLVAYLFGRQQEAA